MAISTENPFRTAVEAMSEPYHAMATAATALARPFQAMARAYRAKRTAEALAALDSRILRDIGVERGKITLIAHSAVTHPAVDPRSFLDR